jgi:chromosome segregation ATPase
MSRFLQWFNLLGILILAVLLAVQWQKNRQLNLDVEALEKTRLEQLQKIAERDNTIAGYVADLDDFRRRLTMSESQLKELDDKLSAMIRERNGLAAQREQLIAQRDQLKATLDKWIAAVAARDAAIKQAGEQVEKLTATRNEAVEKFNDLAGKYNVLVKDLNEARAKIAATRPAGTRQ